MDKIARNNICIKKLQDKIQTQTQDGTAQEVTKKVFWEVIKGIQTYTGWITIKIRMNLNWLTGNRNLIKN